MKTYMKPKLQVYRIQLSHHLMETSSIRLEQTETTEHYDVKGNKGSSFGNIWDNEW